MNSCKAEVCHMDDRGGFGLDNTSDGLEFCSVGFTTSKEIHMLQVLSEKIIKLKKKNKSQN